jgi:septum formation protein
MSLPKVVLASASPRRRLLLEAACLEVVVRPSGADETWPGGSIDDGAMALARRKVEVISAPGDLVVGADTLVVLGDDRLEKPADADDAVRMLRRLAGRQHRVVTGWCVRRDGRERVGAVTTRVTFRRLGDAEIARYVGGGESLDKAGAYGIQGGGGALVDRVEGSYTNVVGLPLAEVLGAIEALA